MPGTNDHRISLLLLLPVWICATSLGHALAMPISLLLRSPWDGLVAGTVIGLLQWSVVASHVKRAGWWIAATAGGLATAGLILPASGLFIRSLGGQALLGLTQYAVLHRSVRGAGWWAPLRLALGWPAAAVVILATASLAPHTTMLAAHAMAGAVRGALLGTATGIALVLLLHYGNRHASDAPQTPPPLPDST